MLFNSVEFLMLLLVTGALYYAPGTRRWQVLILVLASLVFYAAFQPVLLLLLLLSLSINVFSSYTVVHGPVALRRRYATLGVVFNLAVLIGFKYGALLVSTVGLGTTSLGAFLIALPLPLGISFFTFHGITLLVDTYRASAQGSVPTVHPLLRVHALHTALYFLFFPQLVAGPITKSRNFYPQIAPKVWSDVDVSWCFRQIVLGYFLKMVVADNLAQQTYWIAYPYFLNKSSLDLLVMLMGYSMQIFADFAGYSLIALGVAGLFGYRLPDNFNSPYLARSFAEFWTRWHISLSSFLKEYLYVPLGGNRNGQWRTYRNLMLVMLLGGLWHGAAWSFLVWGGAHGLALAVERFLGDRYTPPDTWLLRWARTLFVFAYVSLAWLLFKLTDFSHVIDFVLAMARNTDLVSSADLQAFVLIYALPVLIWHWAREYRRQSDWLRRPAMAAMSYGAMLFLIATNSGVPQSFVYFQF